jgi:hypothetical protein
VQKKLSDYNLKKRLRKGSEIANQVLINIDAQGNDILVGKDNNNVLNFAINEAD